MTPLTMYSLIQSYMEQLPGAVQEIACENGAVASHCMYTPHSLRATTATLLRDSGVDIIKVKDLPGHRHVTTTQNLRQAAPHNRRERQSPLGDLNNGLKP